ncbi:MAG: hypothetical protein IKK34_06990 [Clostridia bacterium]|nr:hypothetical protein [Clostridia bacterium]
MFNWSAFWLGILLVGIGAIGAGLLMLVILFGFWVEDRTGIPGLVVVLVFLFLSIAVFFGFATGEWGRETAEWINAMWNGGNQ